ncbi:Dihydroorotate dehydrogenase (NAD(+)), electron transfer subunit [hydrothermal vent metagenome]|uniref:Dihydroorotate dehydrogenase (NAD(+)), electron transfer subunit n=1 Tax=hydrothermal vent metagenome TaxID=652676 RepID=A0A3B0VBC4_9ZZZZ
MTEFQENSTVTARESLAGDVFRLTVQAPRIAAAAQPGQFVMVRAGDTLDPLLRRPLSIHQVLPDGRLRLLFKVVGKGTGLLAGLGPGKMIDLIGPLGRGFSLGPAGPACLVGGGMGMAPLYFLARWLLQLRPGPGDDQILLGARNRAELKLPAAEFSGLGYPLHLATDDGSLGHHGLVPELLDDVLPSVRQVYVCGPYPMMRTVALKCRDAGVACQVSLETHMACGLGVCLGCAVAVAGGGYKHVCKDGPVFAADEVLWKM